MIVPAGRREARQLRHLDLLHPHELRKTIAQVLVLLQTEFQDFLQICPQLVQARCLRVRAGYARHGANKEPGLLFKFDIGVNVVKAGSRLALP